MELYHLKQFTMEDNDNFQRALDIIDNDKLEAVGQTNFIRRHLMILFSSLDIPLPNLSFEMRYDEDKRSMIVEYDGNSWYVVNYGGKILYYAPRDAYTLSPAFVSVMIFKDLLELLFFPEGNMLTEELI